MKTQTATVDKPDTHPGLVKDAELSQAGQQTGTDIANRTTGSDVAVIDYGEDAGAGMQNLTRKEISIPFYRVLDPKSPQCKPAKAGGLGLKPGDIFNIASGEHYDGEMGIDFVPFYRDYNYPEFIPRNDDGSGGGFVGIRPADDELVLRLTAAQGAFKKLKTAEGTELAETYYLYILHLTEAGPLPAVVAFTSTQIKKYKNMFIARQRAIRYQGPNGPIEPPIYAHVWHLSTVYETKKGTELNWYGWVVKLKEEPSIKCRLSLQDPIYKLAKEMYKSVETGTTKADFSKTREAADTDEEIPF
jgi:hypothetical protein